MTLNFGYDFYKHHKLEHSKQVYTKKGLSGLINQGNTCYLNAALQCLMHTLKLSDYFLAGKYQEDDIEHIYRRKQEYTFLKSYANLVSNFWETNQLIKPRTFLQRLAFHHPKYNGNEQHDSHECYLHILETLHKALSFPIEVSIQGEVHNEQDSLMKSSLESWKNIYEKEYSPLLDIFNGMTMSTINCNYCKKKSHVFEPFNNISLHPGKGERPLKQCFTDTFDVEESISTWVCDKCKNNGCTMSSKLWTLPNVLVVHLKRFDKKGNVLFKNNNNVTFTDEIDLTEYISKDKGDPNNYIYSLYAINYHSGDLNSGHYWASCKSIDDKWYTYDDGNVVKGRSHKDDKNAYVLFYYRKMIPSTD